MRSPLLLSATFALSVFSVAPFAQQPLPDAGPREARPALPDRTVAAGPDYRIGMDDELAVSVLQAPELNSKARVSAAGAISLPLLGTVHAQGLTAIELEAFIERELAARYIKRPDVTVQVIEIRSRAVSVVGAVQKPGIQQITGNASLLDVLSAAGGLSEDAGDAVIVVRKGPDGQAAPIEVKLTPLLESRDPAANIPIRPGDVITVRAAETVYVIGAVKKPGAFVMRGNERMTVLQALALGEGLVPTAAQKDAIVVRTGADGKRQEIAVDLGAVLKGKRPDEPLQAHDVLFVPVSGGKAAARTALDAFIRAISWRPF